MAIHSNDMKMVFGSGGEIKNVAKKAGVTLAESIKINIAVGVGVCHRWVPIRIPMKVTKSKGAVIEELDGKPAVRIYEHYFGKKIEELRKEPLAKIAIAYPFGIISEGNAEFLVRDPIMANSEGGIICAAEIPEGLEIRLMIGSKDNAIEAAKQAAKQAKDHLKEK